MSVSKEYKLFFGIVVQNRQSLDFFPKCARISVFRENKKC